MLVFCKRADLVRRAEAEVFRIPSLSCTTWGAWATPTPFMRNCKRERPFDWNRRGDTRHFDDVQRMAMAVCGALVQKSEVGGYQLSVQRGRNGTNPSVRRRSNLMLPDENVGHQAPYIRIRRQIFMSPYPLPQKVALGLNI